MTFLDIALACIQRGWFVFPCIPKGKRPLGSLAPHGFKDASNDESTVRAWWGHVPDANVAIACGASGLAVLDVDHGFNSEADLTTFLAKTELPQTYAVRTGRRPELGVQFYFTGVVPDVGLFKWHGCEGQIKSAGGYVMAAGSVHPDSGEAYTALSGGECADIPNTVRALRTVSLPVVQSGPMQQIPEGAGRHSALTSVAGKLRTSGLDADAIFEALVPINERVCAVPVSEADLRHIADSVSRYALPEPEPQVLIGGNLAGEPETPPEPVDWRTRYMTEEAYLNVKPPEFLIDAFLVKKSIAMLAGPVAQRKSIIALNIAHALCTGDPLFGYFDVSGGHERVVYLCPEMGAASFVKRIRQIGLGKYMGKTLFVQTMSEKPTALDELGGELPGAVVIVDTITRFIEGDENKSEDMRKFAQKVFRLMNAGATVVLLHHSKKGSSGSLDDGLRGSSELAAFVDSCWVTELEDPKKPYESLSKMRNVKQRDFESDPFKLKPAPGSYYLSMDGDPEPEAALKSKAEDAALDALRKLLAVDPKMGINKLRDALKKAGHRKGAKWVMSAKCTILGTGVTLTG